MMMSGSGASTCPAECGREPAATNILLGPIPPLRPLLCHVDSPTKQFHAAKPLASSVRVGERFDGTMQMLRHADV